MGPIAPPPLSLTQAISAVLEGSGVDLRSWALGFARATPAVTLVPAFGLSSADTPTRTVLALSLGLCIAPALAAQAGSDGSLLVALVSQCWQGLPVALVAALSIYVAQMAGGLVDNLRGGRETVELPVIDEPLPPTATLFGLLSCVLFLESGGAARVAAALSEPLLGARFSWLAVTRALAGSVTLALSIAAPLVVASIVLEVSSALVARAANPAYIAPVVAPLKALALLAVLALVFERLAELLALLAAQPL